MREIYIIIDVNELDPVMYWNNKGPYYNFNHNESPWHLSAFDINNI